MNPKQILHISYNSGNTWGYPIWNAISDAEKRNPKYKLSEDIRKNKIGNIMLTVSYRLDFLPLIIKRINEESTSLLKHVKDRDKSKDKYALGIPEEVTYALLIDIDSFIFELRSCCELMEKLIKAISRDFKKKTSLKIFEQELSIDEWLNAKWYTALKGIRVDMFHHTAPYIDIDISNEPKYDLLFCKEVIHDYSKATNFIRLSELSDIYNGFLKGIGHLQDYIVDKIKQLV